MPKELESAELTKSWKCIHKNRIPGILPLCWSLKDYAKKLNDFVTIPDLESLPMNGDIVEKKYHYLIINVGFIAKLIYFYALI
ncbi:hypothetical protein TNCT_595161 [Trichonephila clavata]|uniref:Uncharacterized protein n=1 Tax=Trichonephila clavata TaxID=2740835 RepID=A0A8X6LIU8_TRICU|nr:hypothetical protein TNCT_595161 [Trichonephila clavata]